MKISIITVCRNAAEGLRLTAESVLSQSYPGIEYVIVDGASTDSTSLVISDIEAKCHEKGVTLRWVSERDGGIYDAMNKGVRMSTGEWVNFMNAGDTFASGDVLEKVFAEDGTDEADIIYGSVNQLLAFGTVTMHPSSLTRLHKKMAFCHQACFVRAAVCREHPYDLQYRVSGDYEFFFWCWQNNKKFLRVDIVVANFESEEGISSRNRLLMNREFARVNGRSKTLKWKVEYIGKVLEVYMNKVVRGIMPSAWNDAVRRRNYKRKAGK